jgi:hypothetical protein
MRRALTSAGLSAATPSSACDPLVAPRRYVPEATVLASALLASGTIPRKAASDAAHIAIAAVHGMDFLVTWNCVHIANAAIARVLASSICREHGFDCPVICTPEELLAE